MEDKKIDTKGTLWKNEVKEIFFQLFKFDKSFFKTYIFYVHIAAQIFFLVFYIFLISNSRNFSSGLLLVIFYPFVALAVRFAFEILSEIFSISDNLREIKEQLKK